MKVFVMQLHNLSNLLRKASYSNNCYIHGYVFHRVILITPLNLVTLQQLHTPNSKSTVEMAHTIYCTLQAVTPVLLWEWSIQLLSC